ncbi:MAG: lipoprotein signal peptidase [Bacteroidota bacterium]
MKRALLIILLVILADQAIKFYIKTHFTYQEQVPMFGDSEWAYLHFTENNGMAFGMEFEGDYGKLFLSIFRIIAVIAIGWYLYDLVKKNAHKGLISAIALVFAGALGNIIDSCFYGMIFSESTVWEVARLFPPEGGYAGFLHGRVVDMFYFPIIDGTFPSWFPIWGGEPFTFFSPVFNLADSSITAGVLLIIIFQRRYFPKNEEPATIQPAPNDGSLQTDTQQKSGVVPNPETSESNNIPPLNG